MANRTPRSFGSWPQRYARAQQVAPSAVAGAPSLPVPLLVPRWKLGSFEEQALATSNCLACAEQYLNNCSKMFDQDDWNRQTSSHLTQLDGLVRVAVVTRRLISGWRNWQSKAKPAARGGGATPLSQGRPLIEPSISMVDSELSKVAAPPTSPEQAARQLRNELAETQLAAAYRVAVATQRLSEAVQREYPPHIRAELYLALAEQKRHCPDEAVPLVPVVSEYVGAGAAPSPLPGSRCWHEDAGTVRRTAAASSDFLGETSRFLPLVAQHAATVAGSVFGLTAKSVGTAQGIAELTLARQRLAHAMGLYQEGQRLQCEPLRRLGLSEMKHWKEIARHGGSSLTMAGSSLAGASLKMVGGALAAPHLLGVGLCCLGTAVLVGVAVGQLMQLWSKAHTLAPPFSGDGPCQREIIQAAMNNRTVLEVLARCGGASAATLIASFATGAWPEVLARALPTATA